MTSEQILLSMFKKSQYESTQRKIQGIVMLMSAAGMGIATILTVFLVNEPISLYLFCGALLFIAAAYLIQKLKLVSRNFATVLYFFYICFVFTPVNWYLTGGMLEATPYISAIVMLAVMIAMTGKMRIRMAAAYTAVLAGLVVYSIITAPPYVVSVVIYNSVAFIAAMVLMIYYMLFTFNRFDQMHDQFLRSSIKDELTRVLSRRVLDVVITHVEKGYKTNGRDYIMIMIDIDKFKHLNDEYGHIVGDIVLRNTAKCINDNTRDNDFVFRYGGDEFLLILDGATEDSAKAIMDRIENTQKCKRLLDFDITVSSGSVKRSECDSPKAAIELADQRMYKDKESRR